MKQYGGCNKCKRARPPEGECRRIEPERKGCADQRRHDGSSPTANSCQVEKMLQIGMRCFHEVPDHPKPTNQKSMRAVQWDGSPARVPAPSLSRESVEMVLVGPCHHLESLSVVPPNGTLMEASGGKSLHRW